MSRPNPRTLRRIAAASILALVSGAAQAAPQLVRPGAQAEEAPGALLPPPPEPDAVIMLRLRDGGIRWGAIADHDESTLGLTLLATGGAVRVPWTMLDPSQSLELRRQFGYVDVEAEEVLIDAERLVLVDGGTVEGVVVSREGDAFLVKSEGNLRMVPKARVTAIEKGLRVPALDIYSTDELYQDFVAQADVDDAASQFELAKQCERIFAFDKALEHYRVAQALDPTFNAEELRNLLPRIEQKAANQEQVEYLRETERLRKRQRWDEALARLDGFDALYPGSPLSQDAGEQRARLLLARDAEAKDFVAKRWRFWMRRQTRDLAAEDNFAQAQAFADEQLPQDIRAKVLEDLQSKISKEATLEEVEALWEQRRKVRYEATTYGNGTWLIGEEAALKGAEGEVEGEQAGPVNDTDRQRQELEERIKRFLKNQRVASRGRQAEKEEDLAQKFWESFSSTHRAMWLLAYYAENSGDLEARPRADLRNCRTCGGKGALEVLLTGGGSAEQQSGSQLQKCPTCRGLGVLRRVHYR